MPKIELLTHINAPIQKVFDLSRSIDLHIESTKQTGERAIAGRTRGLIELGETVTWRAKHFGIRHEHHFSQVDGHTVMKDVFVFKSPLGVLGKLANLLVLKRYMTNLLTTRNHIIKQVAEAAIVPPSGG